jgi:hypothetical protein
MICIACVILRYASAITICFGCIFQLIATGAGRVPRGICWCMSRALLWHTQREASMMCKINYEVRDPSYITNSFFPEIDAYYFIYFSLWRCQLWADNLNSGLVSRSGRHVMNYMPCCLILFDSHIIQQCVPEKHRRSWTSITLMIICLVHWSECSSPNVTYANNRLCSVWTI